MVQAGLDAFWKHDLEDGARAAICAVYEAMTKVAMSGELFDNSAYQIGKLIEGRD